MRKTILFILLLVFTACPVFAASQQTSSTTAATIITNARAYLNQVGSTFCTADQMLVWLNDGMMDLTTLGLSGQETETITLVADTIEYSITSSYIKVVAVFYIDSDGKEKALKQGNVWSVGLTEADLVPDADKIPTFWYEWAGKIGVYPPLAAIDGTTAETVKLYLVKRPAALALSSDDVTTPAIYDKALTLYIAAQGFLRGRQFNKAEVLMDMYYKELGITREDLNTQPIESKPIIKK